MKTSSSRGTHHRVIAVMTAALVVLAFVAAGCGSTTTTTAGGGSATTTTAGSSYGPAETTSTTASSATTSTPAAATTGTTSAGSGNAVQIKSFAFQPASVTVRVGDTVTWTNQDSVSHTVVGDDNSFKSNDIPTGTTFSFTFTKAGTFTYHCSIHPNMTGTVVVQ